MNILIVDDDAYVIEALRKGMNWKELNIDNVYTAFNVKNAKKILESIPIHILLCDIEMPKENGLSLLKWVYDKKFILQSIFITSYDDFEYASQAIELQAFRYTLKPISYDKLSEVIVKAIEKEKQELKAVDYRKGYEFWIDSEKNRKINFWKKLLMERTLISKVDISNYLQASDINYNIDQNNFIGISIELNNYNKIISDIGAGMFEWSFDNIAVEIYQKEGIAVEGVFRKEKAHWILILGVTSGISIGVIKETTNSLIQKIQKQFHCKLICGIGDICDINQLADNLSNITKMCKDNVIYENQILLLREYQYKNIAYLPPNFLLWESLVFDVKEEALLSVANEYLDNLISKRKINKEILYQFFVDFLQMVFAVLKQKHIMLHGWQHEQFNSEIIAEVISSVENMRSYINNIIKDVIKSVQFNEESKSVVDIVIEYIDDNIDKEMTRESLSELVYLNPDYLARLFKKEVGESLGSYITNKRIQLAKNYFETTNDPINVVALKVGYDNFSYFSKVFKDITGSTPKDFKNKLDGEI